MSSAEPPGAPREPVWSRAGSAQPTTLRGVSGIAERRRERHPPHELTQAAWKRCVSRLNAGRVFPDRVHDAHSLGEPEQGGGNVMGGSWLPEMLGWPSVAG